MKIGERPIAFIARTGELTPPGSDASARSYSCADLVSRSAPLTLRSRVCALPLLELVGEVEQPHLLELGRRVQRRAALDPRLGCDRVEHGVALLLRAPVRHREDGVGPVLVRRS